MAVSIAQIEISRKRYDVNMIWRRITWSSRFVARPTDSICKVALMHEWRMEEIISMRAFTRGRS